MFAFFGHGAEGIYKSQEHNYLLPQDLFSRVLPEAGDQATLKAGMHDYAVSLQEVLHEVGKASPRGILAILDCCREELGVAQIDLTPTVSATQRAGKVEPPAKSLIMFATKTGKLALDGPSGGHGLFTEALLDEQIDRCVVGGRSLQQLAAAVKARVEASSQGQQVPNFSENDCAADIYLAGDSYEIVAELDADVFSKFSGGFEGTFADT